MKKHIPIIVAVVVALLFAFAGARIAVYRHLSLQTFYYDFGIFDMAIWKVAHFQAPIIESFTVPGKWIFGDHFSPAIFELAPLYWFTGNQAAIFIAQAIIPAIAGFVIFLAARKMLKNGWLALAVQLTFFLFVGLQNAIMTDFHEVTISTLPLALMIYAFVDKRWRLYVGATVWFLLHKESSFLIAVGLNFYGWFVYKDWRKRLMVLSVISIAYGVTLMKWVIPAFAGGMYQYDVLGPPLTMLRELISPVIKLQTIASSLQSFLYTPLFEPLLWPTYFLHYAPRYLSVAATRWDLGLHYNAEIAPIYALSMMLALRRLSLKHIGVSLLVATLFVGNALYLNYFDFKRPFAYAYNPALVTDAAAKTDVRELLESLPEDKLIMAQNNLAAQLTHGDVMLIRDRYVPYHPAYIVFDTNRAQNGNNWFGVEDWAKFVETVSRDPSYTLIRQVGSFQVYAHSL